MEWRLLESGAGSAAVNMAIDEAVMIGHKLYGSPPTMRFYAWQPAAVSIGRHQDLNAEVNIELCKQLNIGWVRRPTGGRAVLHDEEITYSVVVSQSLIPGSVLETYRVLGSGLVTGLRSLGLDAGMHSPSKKLDSGLAGACFDMPSWYELTISGKKVVGSAQVRSGGVLLQHGSVPLRFDALKLMSVLTVAEGRDPRRMAAALERMAGGLCEVGDRSFTGDEVSAALASGLAGALGVQLVPGDLTDQEQEIAELLADKKYGDKTWNEQRVDVLAQRWEGSEDV